jgi:hypothetical protein
LDLLLKGFGIVAAIITLVIGFRTIKGQGDQLKFQQQQLSEQQSQFETSYKEQIKALEEEYHRRFWEKKLEAYLQLCHVTGILTMVDADSDEYKQARQQFMMIYNGELQVLASPEVKSAFTDFLKALPDKAKFQIHLLPSTSTPANPIAEMVERWFALYKAQANLALACRQDSGSEFHLNDQQVQKYKTNAEDSAQIWATILKQK